MKRPEYLEKISNSVTSKSKKNSLKQELDDHIKVNQAFYEKIGYDEETAENKAVECMGDYEAVSEQLGSVHNTPNYIKGIASTILLLCFLLLKTLVYCNYYNGGSHFSNTFADIALSMVAILIYSLFNMKRKSIPCTIIAVLLSAEPLFWDNLSEAILDFGQYLSLFEIKFYTTRYNDIADYISYAAIAVLVICPIINTIFTIRYKAKISKFKNSKRDLKVRNFLIFNTKILIVINVIIAIVSLLFFSGIMKQAKTDYKNALNAIIDIEMHISDKDVNELLDEYRLIDYIDDEIYEIKSGGTYYFQDFKEAEFTLTYDGQESSDSYANKSKFGYYHLEAKPKCSTVYLDTLMLYNPFAISRQDVIALQNANEDNFFESMDKKEILEYFISYNPVRTSVFAEESGSDYTFYYTGKEADFYHRDFVMARIYFDENGNLSSVDVDTNLEY